MLTVPVAIFMFLFVEHPFNVMAKMMLSSKSNKDVKIISRKSAENS